MFNEIITELNGIWNCQIRARPMMAFLNDAKIIHYFTSLNTPLLYFKFFNNALFEKIKETGSVPDEAKIVLKNPLRAFAKGILFCLPVRNGDFLLSPAFIILNALYTRNIIKWLDIPARQIITIYEMLLNLKNRFLVGEGAFSAKTQNLKKGQGPRS